MTLRENDLFMSKARSNAIIFVKIRTFRCKGKYTLFINRLSNPTFVYRLTGCFRMKGYLFEDGINENIITKLYNIIKDVFFFLRIDKKICVLSFFVSTRLLISYVTNMLQMQTNMRITFFSDNKS